MHLQSNEDGFSEWSAYEYVGECTFVSLNGELGKFK
jgi:hypothetical protein